MNVRPREAATAVLLIVSSAVGQAQAVTGSEIVANIERQARERFRSDIDVRVDGGVAVVTGYVRTVLDRAALRRRLLELPDITSVIDLTVSARR